MTNNIISSLKIIEKTFFPETCFFGTIPSLKIGKRNVQIYIRCVIVSWWHPYILITEKESVSQTYMLVHTMCEIDLLCYVKC